MKYAIRTILAVLGLLIATSAMAQDDYRIRAGDTLVVEVLEDPSLNRSVIVLPDGRFSFPFAGTVQGKGRTVGQIEAAIGSSIASNFAAPPNVFVAVQPAERKVRASGGSSPKAKRTIEIYLLGEVSSPGLREVEPGTTFLQALAQSGGLSPFAATKRIQIRRTDARGGAQKLIKINYKALTNGANLSRDVRMKDGDVILVPERRLFE